MKKFPSILFVFSLLFMLTACSSSADPSQESSGQTTSPSSQQDSVSVSNAVLESESTESEQSANNTLIVYFSRWGNTEYPSDVDAITSASIVVDNNSRYGTTEYVANMIAENVGGDLHRIETVTPYTADFDELRDVNHDEMNSNYLPELKESNLDISAYDTVFIGYPVWATDVPQAVLSFLKEYDLSGKTVIPFCTHDGYGAGNSYQTIAESSHAAVLLEGIAIEAKDVPNAQDTVSSWLHSSRIAIQNPEDYEARSNIMWAATWALNTLVSRGKSTDWMVHMLGQAVGAYTDATHGMTLSAVSLPYYQYIMPYGLSKFCRFAVNVWEVNPAGKADEQVAREGLSCMEVWMKELGLTMNLHELGVTEEILQGIANGTFIMEGGYKVLKHDEVLEILKNSL